MPEVQEYRRNLVSMWLYQKKLIDSISHSWVLEVIRLANVLVSIVKAMAHQISLWNTILKLNTWCDYIMTDRVQYRRVILQGYSFVVMLFIPSVNSLTFMSRKFEGHFTGSQ